MKALIVEDDSGIRMALELLLELEGHSCVTVTRGEDGVSIVEDGGIDVVLLDLKTDGISAGDFIRRLPANRPPVVVMSASHTIAEEAAQAGADRYVRKPFEQDELFRAMTEVQAQRPGAVNSGLRSASSDDVPSKSDSIRRA